MSLANVNQGLRKLTVVLVILTAVFGLMLGSAKPAEAATVSFGPDSRAECLYGSGRVQVSSYLQGQSHTYIRIFFMRPGTSRWGVAYEGYGGSKSIRVPAYSAVNVDVYFYNRPGTTGWTLARTKHMTFANWGRGLEARNTGDVCYA